MPKNRALDTPDERVSSEKVMVRQPIDHSSTTTGHLGHWKSLGAVQFFFFPHHPHFPFQAVTWAPFRKTPSFLPQSKQMSAG